MDFSLSDHQGLIRDTVREFMEAEVRPHVKEWERAEYFPAEAIRKLGEMGCCGMLMPEEWGGRGAGFDFVCDDARGSGEAFLRRCRRP